MISSAPSWMRTLGGGARAVRRAVGVLGHERDGRIVEIEQRELGGLLQCLGHGRGRARADDRQEQRDLDRAGRAGDGAGPGPARPPARRAASATKERRRPGVASTSLQRSEADDRSCLEAAWPLCSKSRGRRNSRVPWSLAAVVWPTHVPPGLQTCPPLGPARPSSAAAIMAQIVMDGESTIARKVWRLAPAGLARCGSRRGATFSETVRMQDRSKQDPDASCAWSSARGRGAGRSDRRGR